MRLRFGDFTLDTDTRQLRQGAVERHLSPKGFDLLRLLIDSRPRVVSKRELHERLWPATFVSEATLSSLIAEVRDALGERGQSGHGVIRTVHRIGYGFDGDASDASARPADAHVRCWLVWNLGQVALRDGDHLLGRDGDVTVMLESATVSRHHARIRVDGDSATIEDLGSRNGTFVRGRPIAAPSPLVDGDEITLGSVIVRFRRARTDVLTETAGL